MRVVSWKRSARHRPEDVFSSAFETSSNRKLCSHRSSIPRATGRSVLGGLITYNVSMYIQSIAHLESWNIS